MSQDLIRRVLGELQRRFRVAGRGSVKRVERELDLGAGYFKDQRRPGRRRVDLRLLFRALEALSVDPAEFFAAIMGGADPVAGFEKEAATLRRRTKPLPRILQLESKPAAGGSARETDPDLAGLDSLRYENPELVLRRARSLLPRVTDARVPQVLGIYASACRVAGRLNEAQMVLGRALELARERCGPAVLGDLLLRAGYVDGTRLQLERAHDLAERATLLFAKSGDLAGIGRALVEQGLWQGHLDRPRHALRSLTAALEYLPREAAADPLLRRNQFSCLLSLGLLHRQLGDLRAARSYARAARASARGIERVVLGKLTFLRASIAHDLDELERAEALYGEALATFQPAAPMDALLCAVKLARLQLGRGRTAAAYETAKAAAPVVESLEPEPMVSAALTELLGCALAGRGLSEALLERVARGLEEGPARRRRHADPQAF